LGNNSKYAYAFKSVEFLKKLSTKLAYNNSILLKFLSDIVNSDYGKFQYKHATSKIYRLNTYNIK
jgi:hypothetical protein